MFDQGAVCNATQQVQDHRHVVDANKSHQNTVCSEKLAESSFSAPTTVR